MYIHPRSINDKVFDAWQWYGNQHQHLDINQLLIQKQNFEDWSWNWSASSGEYPNQYQRDRMVQILGNHPDQNFVQIMPIHHGLPCPTGASSLSTTPTMAMSQNRATSLLFTLILKILHNGNLPVGLTYDLIVCGGGPYRPDVLDSMWCSHRTTNRTVGQRRTSAGVSHLLGRWTHVRQQALVCHRHLQRNRRRSRQWSVRYKHSPQALEE